MTHLPPPTTQKQEVLFELLKHKSISVRQVLLDTGILNPKARLSELRTLYNLPIATIWVETKNKYDRRIKYGTWELLDKPLGEKIYLRLISEEKR
jgi:hypothetical protein